MMEKAYSITQPPKKIREYDAGAKHRPDRAGFSTRINSEQYPPLKEKLRALSRQVAERNRQLYKELENV